MMFDFVAVYFLRAQDSKPKMFIDIAANSLEGAIGFAKQAGSQECPEAGVIALYSTSGEKLWTNHTH